MASSRAPRSARRRPLIIAPQARQGLSDLLLYSEPRWGKRQRSTYKATLDRAIDELTRFPGLGRPRDDISPGLRGGPVGEHVIFYPVDVQGLTITRILHKKMDAAGQLDEP